MSDSRLPPAMDTAFIPGEKSLCFHGPLMYEAKVIKADIWDKNSNESGETGPHYFVHYKGWKQTWDEWVPEERLKKYNDENIKQQRILINAQMIKDQQERIALAKSEQLKPTQPTRELPPRREEKRLGKRHREGEGEEDYLKRPEIKISIPELLKVQLVDDWEAITKNQQLVPIPRNPSVDQILEQYTSYVEQTYPDRQNLTSEVTLGLRLYFNKCLGNNLLYKFERGQYSDHFKTLTEDQEVSSIYGAEHLLRLFVNLPELIAHTVMDVDTVRVLKENMVDFLKWMAQNQASLFSDTYQNTASPYQNLNRA